MRNYLVFLDKFENIFFDILFFIIVILFGIAFLSFDTLKCVIIYNVFFYFYFMFFFVYFILYIFYDIIKLIKKQ